MHRVLVRTRSAFTLLPTLLATCTLLVAALAGPPATANVYFVDAGIAVPSNGSTWALAMSKIEDAISAASAGDQIFVKAGNYRPDLAFASIDGYVISGKHLLIYGGFDGTELTLQQRVGLFDTTVLDAHSNTRCFTILSASSTGTVVIDGFKIINGEASGSTFGTKGGAIYSTDSHLLIGNCVLDHNHAPVNGGGLYFSGSSETSSWRLNIMLTTFNDNWVNEGKGGAIFGSRMTGGDLVNTVFSQNRVTLAGDGGAVYLEDMGGANQLRITNCVYWRNSANGATAKGGGMCLGETSPTGGGNVKIVNCTFVGDVVSSSSNGPALSVSANSICAMHNSILFYNTVNGTQSAVHTYAGPIAPLTWCDLEGGAFLSNITSPPLFRSVAFANGLTLQNGSPCLDRADKNQIPDDFLDINGDGLMIGQQVPIDLNKASRDIDWVPASNLGIPSGTFVDMGAYEKQ